MADILRQRTRSEWDEILSAADVPFGPILDVVEALAQESVVERGVMQSFVHPDAGKVEVIGSPIRFKGQGERTPLQPPPRLGEHTQEILSGLLDYDAETISRLLEKGVIEEHTQPLLDAAAGSGPPT